jgi:hypothetical protein
VKRCKDCPPGSRRRAAPHPGPRCATHHRARLAEVSEESHARHIGRLYGITRADYERLRQVQGGLCYICRRATGKQKRLPVDHNHATKEVRGLLCGPCNKGVLGHLRDDIAALQRAIDYLTNPPAREVLRRTS